MCEYCGRREGHGHDVFCPNNPYTRFDARCCECGAGLLESMDEIYYDEDGVHCASCHERLTEGKNDNVADYRFDIVNSVHRR